MKDNLQDINEARVADAEQQSSFWRNLRGVAKRLGIASSANTVSSQEIKATLICISQKNLQEYQTGLEYNVLRIEEAKEKADQLLAQLADSCEESIMLREQQCRESHTAYCEKIQAALQEGLITRNEAESMIASHAEETRRRQEWASSSMRRITDEVSHIVNPGRSEQPAPQHQEAICLSSGLKKNE